MHAHAHVDALSDVAHRSPRLGHDCVRTPSSDMLFSTSAARNCGPIAKVISEFFDRSFTVSLLELASGTGQHIVHFASTWPHARCLQPSELNADSLKSIECYTKGLAERENIRNIRSPLVIDVAAPFSQWGLPSESFDIVFVGNLLHISPPAATRVGIRKTLARCFNNHMAAFRKAFESPPAPARCTLTVLRRRCIILVRRRPRHL